MVFSVSLLLELEPILTPESSSMLAIDGAIDAFMDEGLLRECVVS